MPLGGPALPPSGMGLALDWQPNRLFRLHRGAAGSSKSLLRVPSFSHRRSSPPHLSPVVPVPLIIDAPG